MASSLPCATPPVVYDSDTLVTMSSVTPSVTVSAFPNDTICTGDSITFTAQPFNGGPSPQYQWQVNGVNVGNNTAVFGSSTLNSGDSVSVTLTSNATCASPVNATSATIPVLIEPYTIASVSISIAPDTVCIGGTASFTSSIANGGNNPSYQWVVNGNVEGSNSPSFTLSPVLQNTVVTAVMTSDVTCATPNPAISNQVIINTYQPLSVAASDSITICEKESTTLFATATGGDGSGYSYSWSNHAGTDSAVTVNPSATANYVVTVTDGCGSFPSSDSVQVNVLAAPQAFFSYNPGDPSSLYPQVFFTDHSVDATAWFWNFGDGDTSSQQNPSHVYASAGTFDVTSVVTNALGCTDTLVFTIIVKEDLSFFVPNSFTPNGDGKNDIFAPLGTSLGDYEMFIYDRWGNEIFRGGPLFPWAGQIANGKEVVPGGVYLYKIDLKDARFKQEIVTGRVTVIH
jgi:gliding motility-associated-like protein